MTLSSNSDSSCCRKPCCPTAMNSSPFQLKLKAAFASRVRQCLDPAVIEVTASIEDDLAHALRERPLGQKRPQRLGAFDAPAYFVAELFFDCRCRSQRVPFDVIDQLHMQMLIRSKYGKPRPLGSTFQSRSDATLALVTYCLLRARCSANFNGHKCFLLLLGSGSLALLADDMFVRIFDPFALVGFRFFERPNLRGNHSDQYFVGAADDQMGVVF